MEFSLELTMVDITAPTTVDTMPCRATRVYYSGGLGYSSGYQVRRPVYHDTTHLDYHGPSLQRHGLHYHVVPGHYDVHHTGHFDH
ncbi:MAG: hypothetical protein R3C09_07280 [Pirellulaceae bacterium]